MSELYEELLPTRLCASQKTHTSSEGEAWCGLYGKAPESVDHIMSGCDALAQSKYLSMTYCLMWDAYIVDAVPPLYCLVKPRPVYESDDVKAYWDVPGFAHHEDVTTESSITRPSGSLHSQ